MARRAFGQRDEGVAVVTTAVSESAAAIAPRVRDARARNAPLRIVGAGTWLDAGRPIDASNPISLAAHSGIVAYTPGDLTLTAKAGTTLREIHDAVAPHGQWLALDPYGSDAGTIGATIATASAGPLSTRFGGPRDLTLGVEFVSGRGAIVRGGGRVVKNVAGFDLTRLLTGSWGTLGIITEATVRLHARPEIDVTLAVPASASGEIERIRATINRWPFVPFACELVSDALGQRLGVGGASTLFRLGGNSESVAAQRRAVAELGDARELDADVWRALRAAEGEAAIVLRVSRAPSDVGVTWGDGEGLIAAQVGAWASASITRGIVRCVIPSSASAKEISAAVARLDSRVIVERGPAEIWNAPSRARSNGQLQSRVRDAFDPVRLLNRGILGTDS